ncbi:hypothetical protein D3C86_1938470 [compost metagenome]
MVTPETKISSSESSIWITWPTWNLPMVLTLRAVSSTSLAPSTWSAMGPSESSPHSCLVLIAASLLDGSTNGINRINEGCCFWTIWTTGERSRTSFW